LCGFPLASGTMLPSHPMPSLVTPQTKTGGMKIVGRNF
jgi:hypothetical protein